MHLICNIFILTNVCLSIKIKKKITLRDYIWLRLHIIITGNSISKIKLSQLTNCYEMIIITIRRKSIRIMTIGTMTLIIGLICKFLQLLITHDFLRQRIREKSFKLYLKILIIIIQNFYLLVLINCLCLYIWIVYVFCKYFQIFLQD